MFGASLRVVNSVGLFCVFCDCNFCLFDFVYLFVEIAVKLLFSLVFRLVFVSVL